MWWSHEPPSTTGTGRAKSTNREGVVPWICHFFRLVSLSTSSNDSHSHDNGEWGSIFLGVTSWNNLIPSLCAVHIQEPGDFSGACLAEPELHLPIRTLSNFCTLELTPTIRYSPCSLIPEKRDSDDLIKGTSKHKSSQPSQRHCFHFLVPSKSHSN